MKVHRQLNYVIILTTATLAFVLLLATSGVSAQVQNPQSGSVGLQGAITAPPPTSGAIISIPRSGQAFTNLPVTVSGICPNGLLVKLYKNNVFGGAVQCNNGSFSLIIDLFNGQNDLVAKVVDALDQSGPDSSTVSVSFNDAKPKVGARISLTSIYAKRGANPKQDLSWPVEITGGNGPYALSADWGDSKSPDLSSQQFPGTLNLKHQYDSPGVYNVIIKATDKNGDVAFLQLVGVGNGTVSQDVKAAESTTSTTITNTKIIWWPAVVLLPFVFVAFWLGSRSSITALKKRIARGEPAFKK